MASSRRAGTNESKWTGPPTSAWSAGVNTFGATGNGRDYTSVSTWESDTDVDIVAAQVCPVIECYADSASYAVVVTFTGATTSATYRRIIRAAATARHGGVPGAGVKFTGTAVSGQVYLNEAYCQVEDIEVLCTASSASAAYGVRCANLAGVTVVGVISRATNTGAGAGTGFYAVGSAVLVNCIAYGCKTNGFQIGGNAAGRTLNCTSVGNTGFGYESSSPHDHIKNCIGYNNTGGDFESNTYGSDTDYNLSSDASAPGTHKAVNATLTFNNAANDDYRLASTDTAAIGAGTDLSADTWAFDDDIAFTTRS